VLYCAVGLASYINYGFLSTVDLSYDIKLVATEIYESNWNGNNILFETSVYTHTQNCKL